MSSKKSKKQPVTPIAPDTPADSAVHSDAATLQDAQYLREEVVRWVCTICSAVLVYLVVAVTVWKTYKPDIDSLQAIAKQKLILPALALPEPMEALLFRLGIVIIIPGLLGFYLLFSKARFVTKLATEKVFNYLSVALTALVAAIIFIAFAAHNESEPGKDRVLPVDMSSPSNNNFNFYFDGFFLGKYLWVYVLVIVPGMAYLLLEGIRKKGWGQKSFFRTVLPIAGYLISGAVLIEIMAMHTFDFPYAHENKFDFNAVYYSMTQVFAGVPMLVDGFTNTYGLYPHFLSPLFQIIGLNVLKFSFVMALLQAVGFALNFYLLRRFVRNDLLLFLGFATMLFFSFLDRKLQNHFDCFFALTPIRYIIPSLLGFMASRFLLNPSRREYWITTVVMACSVLWNPEMGIVCYLSWIVVNIYKDFYSGSGTINIKGMAIHAVVGLGLLPLVFVVYKLLIFAFYGASPDMGLLWSTVAVFSKVGFNLLPMAVIHPWNVVALIIIVGFVYAIAKWYKKEITPRSSMVLLLSLVGVGYLAYYQGRSHSVNLSVSSGFAILLLTIFGDELWSQVQTRKMLLFNALFVVFLFLTSFSVIELAYNTDKMQEYIHQDADKEAQAQEQEFTESNREFLLQNSVEGERILLLTVAKLQGLYFERHKRRSAFNPGLIDMFLTDDLKRFEQTLADSAFSIFMEPPVFNYPYMFRTVATVAARYDYIGANKSMVHLKKRTMAIPAKRFFGGEPQMAVHRKYDDTKLGIDMRVHDALGMGAITLAPQFSVEVLFHTQVQLYPYATVIGNFNNYQGFMISNVTGNQYVISVDNIDNSVRLTLPHKSWQYIVLNVFPDHFDVYQNGRFMESRKLPEPMHQSKDNLFVGNMGNPHYYLGAIAEAALINKTLDSGQVRKTWEEIEHTVDIR